MIKHSIGPALKERFKKKRLCFTHILFFASFLHFIATSKCHNITFCPDVYLTVKQLLVNVLRFLVFTYYDGKTLLA